MADAAQDAYDALCCYTLEHGDLSFIHQHVVDAFAAQRADERTKPIAVTFALVGLYLHVERQFTGKQVQQAHMALARHKTTWPVFPLPAHRGRMTAVDVMNAPAGAARDEAIHRWSASVWEAFEDHHHAVEALLRRYDIV
jgi:hypothetical protein